MIKQVQQYKKSYLPFTRIAFLTHKFPGQVITRLLFANGNIVSQLMAATMVKKGICFFFDISFKLLLI